MLLIFSLDQSEVALPHRLLSQGGDGGMRWAEVWIRVHFNRRGTTVVKFETHPSTLPHDEVFGRPMKMRNVFAGHLFTSCYFKNLLIFLTPTNLANVAEVFSSFLSFSWRQHVLHLHHSVSVRRPGHLRSRCAHITDGSRLVRQNTHTSRSFSALSWNISYIWIDFMVAPPWRTFGTFSSFHFGEAERPCLQLIGSPAPTLWSHCHPLNSRLRQ